MRAAYQGHTRGRCVAVGSRGALRVRSDVRELRDAHEHEGCRHDSVHECWTHAERPRRERSGEERFGLACDTLVMLCACTLWDTSPGVVIVRRYYCEMRAQRRALLVAIATAGWSVRSTTLPWNTYSFHPCSDTLAF